MISDRELRELFQQKAEDMDIDRAIPGELLKRARRRQGLIAMTGAAAVLAVILAVWIGTGTGLQSEAIPPANEKGVVEEIDVQVEGRPPTVEALEGIWLNDGGPTPGEPRLMLMFEPDGTVSLDNGGNLDSHRAVLGTYEVNGDTISFRNEDGSACLEGDEWTWRVGVPDEGRLHIVFIEDGTGNCSAGIGTEWTFTRVSPSSPAGEQITAAGRGQGPSVPPERYSLSGIYLLEGTGDLMRITGQETYSIDQDGKLGVDPYDQGSLDNNAKGTLRFISGADSKACDKGAVTVWKRVRISGRVVRAVVTRGDCVGEVGAELTWIRLSP